jgi:hypothetical protein
MFTITEATQNMFWPNIRHFSPNVRMSMCIPILKAVTKGVDEFINCFKPTPLECQCFQLFPPGFNQIEPTGILRNKLKTNFRPSHQSRFNIARLMNRKVVFDYQPAVTGKGSDHLFQQLDVRGAVTGRAAQDSRQTGGRFEGTVDPDSAASAVIRLESSPIRAQFPFLTGIGLDSDRSQLIDADIPCVGSRLYVSPDDGPLFSTNCGSCLSGCWNQLCCRFQSRPSACIHFQMVEGLNRSPYRSSYLPCNRVNVHNSNGNPSDRGFCKAKSITRDRTSSVWVTGLPDRGLSSSPATPSSLNRLTQADPELLFLKPTCMPAFEASSMGSSSMATINRARCTRRSDSLRELASRLISVSSSVVNVLSKTRGLDILPFQTSEFGRYYNPYTWEMNH